MEAVIGVIGCLFCAIGSCFCIANRVRSRRSKDKAHIDTISPDDMLNAIQMREVAMDQAEQAERMEAYILRERAAAAEKILNHQQQQQQQQPVPGPITTPSNSAPTPPTPPTPMVVGSDAPRPQLIVMPLSAPASRPVICTPGYSPYTGSPYVSVVPQYPFQQAPFTGAPVYYVR